MTPTPDSNVKKTLLKNGIRLITKRMPHIRSVSLGVWVNVGARDETQTESGLSHFIEHMIFKGTKTRTAFQIAREFDAIGGYTNAFTSMENTCYHAKVMGSHLDTMVDILSDIFLNSLFDRREVERERPVILQEIGMTEDNPDEYVHQLSAKTFWGDNPLGRSILGSRENLLNFDADNIKDFFHRFYQPERIVISAAGDLSHDGLTGLIRRSFESIQPGNGFPERLPPRGHFGIEMQTRSIEQTHFCICAQGLPATEPRRFALSLLNTILGGNMSSRLFQEIREKRGLAYSVYSFINSYLDAGMLGVYAGVDPANIAEAIRVVVSELRKLVSQPVSRTELQAAKEFTKGSLFLASESNDNQMVRLAQGEFNFGYYQSIEQIVENIEQVTTDDIRDLAVDLFQPTSLSLTMLGPAFDMENARDMLKL